MAAYARLIAATVIALAATTPAFAQTGDVSWAPSSGVPGAIPETSVGAIQSPGLPRDVAFTVTGMPGTVTNVIVQLKIDHPAIGELWAELQAPDGTRFDLFKWMGATTPPGGGFSIGFGTALSAAAPVVLYDGASQNLWTVAGQNIGGLLPAGSYRTVTAGGWSGGGSVTSLDTIFEGRQPNGVWHLYVRDGANITTPARSGTVQDVRLRLITQVLPTVVATNDNYTTQRYQALYVNTPGVLANDTTPVNSPRRQVELMTLPTLGTVTLNADGSFSYFAFNIGPDSFNYRVRSAGGYSNVAAAIINVVPAPPIAVDDDYATPFATALTVAAPGVLGNDASDVSMTASVATPPAHGSVTMASTGGFTYTPNPAFAGIDSFVYTATNSAGARQGTVRVAVAPPVSPTANADAYSTALDAPIVVAAPGVLGNDVSQAPLTAAIDTPPLNGVLSLNADGSFTFTPNFNYAGTDSFTYRAAGAGVSSAPATVTLRVAAAGATAPPANLRVAQVTGNQVRLRWDAPSGPAPTGYVVEGGVSPGQVLASLPVPNGATALDFTAPNGSFVVRVHALGPNGRSVASNEVPLHVNVPVVPSAPDRLLATVSGSALLLSWRNTFGGGAATGMQLDVTGSYTGSLPVPAGESYLVPSTPPGTYTFRVRQSNAAGASAPSTPVTVTVPAACTGVPGTPTNVLAYRVGNVLTLTWDPPPAGTAVSGYLVRATGAVTGTFPIGSRTLSVAVNPGTYNLEVAATNCGGQSGFSPAASVTVP